VPARLEPVLAFVNTHARHGNPDELADAATTEAWLESVGRTDVVVDAAAPARLRALRDALRTTLLAHVGLVDEEVAAAALAPVCEGATLGLVIGAGAAAEVAGAGSGLDGLVNDLLAAVAIASIDGSWERAKACVSDDCRNAFWDGTKNRSGRFCSTAGCANRARQREFRARQRAAAEH
jgi:predicted RNA-binding Zn ribbon-like protein